MGKGKIMHLGYTVMLFDVQRYVITLKMLYEFSATGEVYTNV